MDHHLWMQIKGKVMAMCLGRRYVLILVPYILGATAGCDSAASNEDSQGLMSRPEKANESALGDLVSSSSTNSFLRSCVDSDLLVSINMWSVDVWRRSGDEMTAVPRRGTIPDIKAAFSAAGVCGTDYQGVVEHSEMFSVCGCFLVVTWLGVTHGNYFDVRICTFIPQGPKKIIACGRDIFASGADEYELCCARTFNNVTDVVVTQKCGDCLIVVYGDMNPCSEGQEVFSLINGELILK